MTKRILKNSKYIPYNTALNVYAREMRNNSTKGEIKFWCELLRNKMSGYQFYRQKPILKYIVDFYCAKLKLVVEIDGTSHLGKDDYDLKREKDLKDRGLKIIRYDDLKVLYNFHSVEKDFSKQISIREIELNL